MATASKRKSRVPVETSLTDDLLDTRAVWSEHMAVIAPNAMELAADVGKMAVDLANSPLGQRARRHPEISFAVGAIGLELSRDYFGSDKNFR